jgi:hypothetical protein
MIEQKWCVDRREMIRLCMEKALEVVDAVNAVPHCGVYKVVRAEPLREGTGVIRLDITFKPPRPRD